MNGDDKLFPVPPPLVFVWTDIGFSLRLKPSMAAPEFVAHFELFEHAPPPPGSDSDVGYVIRGAVHAVGGASQPPLCDGRRQGRLLAMYHGEEKRDPHGGLWVML